MRGIYIAETPLATPIPREIIWPTAESAAREVKGMAMQGSGNSMLPLYEPGTVLVIAPTSYQALKRGQTVIYYKDTFRPVAHVLIAKTGRGWRVAGLNNETHDGVGVTPDNLFGVVVAAYQPIDGQPVAVR